METATLKFLGAAQTVTGSKSLLSYKGFNLLIDCGLYQGVERKQLLNKDQLHFDPLKIDAVILTHAHLDHCGYIPRLVADGYNGPILATSATRDLSRIIMMDAAKIQLSEVREAKKRNLSKRQVGEPLYYDHDVKHAMSFFRPLEYGDELELGPFKITLHQAGHIPGAASVGVEFERGSILFSGDLGRYDDLMTFDPKVRGKYENIVIESTYGARDHDGQSQFDALKEVIEKVIKKRGSLLIPAFSLSRTQLLLLQLKEIFNAYPKLKLPVHVNSPMASEVTEVMIRYHQTIRQDLEEIKDALTGFHFVEEPWEAKSLYEDERQKIVLSASGMLSGGRVLNHLVAMAEDEKNIIFIPGFQAPETLGAEVVEGLRQIEVNDVEIEIKAEVIHSKVFSAHGDQAELVRWLSELEEAPRRIFLNHGRKESMEIFSSKLKEKWESLVIEIPELNQSYYINE